MPPGVSSLQACQAPLPGCPGQPSSDVGGNLHSTSASGQHQIFRTLFPGAACPAGFLSPGTPRPARGLGLRALTYTRAHACSYTHRVLETRKDPVPEEGRAQPSQPAPTAPQGRLKEARRAGEGPQSPQTCPPAPPTSPGPVVSRPGRDTAPASPPPPRGEAGKASAYRARVLPTRPEP